MAVGLTGSVNCGQACRISGLPMPSEDGSV